MMKKSGERPLSNLSNSSDSENNSRKSVLLIDDNEDILSVLKAFLVDEGLNVEIADNGSIGIEKIKHKTFDIVFCDIKMPKVDGWEFISWVMDYRLKYPMKTIIFAMTAFSENEIEKRAMNSGFSGIIFKPFAIENIMDKIKGCQG